jgi:UDP-N-acetylglucosamine 2-epimerase (non-hydrolysing)
MNHGERKVAVVMGTRPEGIKLAPVVAALARRGVFKPIIVSTGQHREMLAQALELFELVPHFDLGVMSPGQTLYDVTCRTLERLRPILTDVVPEWIVVQGDTTTALAAALAGFYEKLPVAHVEAGLRSGQRYSPFPEEINRRMIDQLSEVLFAPTAQARELLLSEGMPRDMVHITGNTVVDALKRARDLVRRDPPEIDGLDLSQLEGRRLVLVTAHRRESFGEGMEAICRAMLEIVRRCPDVHLVYPVHANPNVDRPVRRILSSEKRITLLNPISYRQFVCLMERAALVLTDSGGIQEEAPSLGKPVLVMREVTERPEGVAAGVARLVGTTEERIVAAAVEILTDPEAYAKMARGANPYGDGYASDRIAELLERHTRRGTPRVAVPIVRPQEIDRYAYSP